MKKLSTLFLIGILLLTGCQKTPDKPIVIQKDLEQMLDTAQKEPGTDVAAIAAGVTDATVQKSLAEQYGIPAAYNWESQGTDGIISIKVNAQITVPAGGKMPIYRVTAADFSQEIVSLLFDRLCKDKAMVEIPTAATKDQLEAWIIDARRALENPEYADQPHILEFYEEEIARFEALYPTAPETIAPVPCTGQLSEIVQTLDAGASYRYTGISAHTEDAQTYFNVTNNNNLTEAISVEHTDAEGNVIGVSGVPLKRGAVLGFSTAASKKNYAQHPLQRITDESAIPAEAQGKLTITPAEARKIANSILAGTDMAVQEIYLTDDENLGDYDGKVSPAETYIYRVHCVRQVEGIPQAFLRQFAMPDQDTMMAPTWDYEWLEMYIGNAGVILFTWQSPHTVSDLVVEDAALLPFADVMAIFEKMLPVTVEGTYGRQPYQAVDIEIDHIALELQRILEQNSIENGLLVPVWNFYGTRRNTDESGKAVLDHNGMYDPHSLLTINAIDGSIIDVSRGY